MEHAPADSPFNATPQEIEAGADLPLGRNVQQVRSTQVPLQGLHPVSRKSLKERAIGIAAIYPLLLIAPLTILTLLNRESDRPYIAELGADSAVVGFTILALQFVLTARLAWLERPFGLDLILVFHRFMALVAVGLLCSHPLLIASAEGWSLLSGLRVPWYIWIGRGTLALLLLHVAVSLGRRAVHLSYERWRRLHNGFALSILAGGLVHSLWAGDEMHTWGGAILWSLAPAVALGAWIYSRAIRVRRLGRRLFRVLSIEPAARGVWTLTLEPSYDHPFSFAPGQFGFLRLLGSDVSNEEHPFTIASSAAQTDRISFTIKESGDFTRQLTRVHLGEGATVHGPFGRFSNDVHPDEQDLVFIAGGVGITPLMSMLRSMRDRQEPRSVTLVCANRTVDDMLFTAELSAIEAGLRPWLKVIHVLSQPPSDWTGESGRVDTDRLKQWCGGFEGKSFYLCCPGGMTKQLIGGLKRLGVSPRRIHCDYFSL